MCRRTVVTSSALITLLSLAGCPDKPTGGQNTVAGSATASASASAAAGPMIPAPTKVDEPNLTGMRYYTWDPPVAVPGATVEKRAEQVLASATLRKLLGMDPAKDGFRHLATAKDGKVTYIQTLAWQGQTIPVHRAMATVAIVDGAKLAYVGTGFRKGIALDAAKLTVDQQQAGVIAAAEYERIEKAPGKVTPHRHPGLYVYRAAGGVHLPGYDIHVERKDGEGHGRPYLILVNAQTGKVVRSQKSWVE